MEDLSKAIAYEVKQEIANRYFGFRMRIEAEAHEYAEMLQEAAQKLDAIIGLDLCRIRYLLQEPRLFCAFLLLSGLPREYAMGLTNRQSSPRVHNLFCTLKLHGFTRWQKFRGLAMTSYLSLAENIAIYHQAFQELQEEHADICSEIEKFHRQNDLSDILCYLRELDSLDSERLKFLHSGATLEGNNHLDHDLRIIPPPPVTNTLISLNIIPPIEDIKGRFIVLLKEAFAKHSCRGLAELPF